ncbi:MAG: putative manganese transporter [Candidatus Puniceispirillaceae bacterium]
MTLLTANQTLPLLLQRQTRFPVILVLLAGWLAIWAFLDQAFAQVIISTIADAYLQVTTFVAATLLFFYGLERVFGISALRILSQSGKWQVPMAAALGALPGCGGAIIVVTNYVSGRLSFGAVLATLTATMGDAAFLLIAKEPMTGLLIMAIGLVVGTITGMCADKIHGRDFLRPSYSEAGTQNAAEVHSRQDAPDFVNKLWLIAIVPGIILGICGAFQIDLDPLFANSVTDQPVTLFGFAAGLLCFAMWLLPRFVRRTASGGTSHDSAAGDTPVIWRQTIADTNFVTGWVIIAFLIFEVSLFATGYDLTNLFDGVALWVPLIAVVIGLLPGCGPQVLVTSLYLAGIVPLSAQIGNAISNDGDALFPAIALAPRAALVATFYSTLPALLLAYGWYFYHN